MSLPVFRRFSIQDIPTAPSWILSIITPLNLFCETTLSSLNKNLTIGENVQGQKFTFSITTNATGKFNPITFQYSGGGQPNCCLLGRIDVVSGTALTTAVTVSKWFLNINITPFEVTIEEIVGLAPNTKYNVVFLVV